MDIVVEGNRITSVRQAGWPGLPVQANREPRDFDYEIDATGMYVMPGFVDMHVHGSTRGKAPDLGYSYKLWLAHGVTTVRGVSLISAALSSSEKNRSARNEIVAPRIFNYQVLGSGWDGGPVRSTEKAREYVRWAAANNIDGSKFFNRGDETPEIIKAAIQEAKANKMGTVAHLSQNGVANFNARDAGQAGRLAAVGVGRRPDVRMLRRPAVQVVRLLREVCLVVPDFLFCLGMGLELAGVELEHFGDHGRGHLQARRLLLDQRCIHWSRPFQHGAHGSENKRLHIEQALPGLDHCSSRRSSHLLSHLLPEAAPPGQVSPQARRVWTQFASSL